VPLCAVPDALRLAGALLLGASPGHVLAIPLAAIALKCRGCGRYGIPRKPSTVANLWCESDCFAVFFEPDVLRVLRLVFVEITVKGEILIELAAVNCESLHSVLLNNKYRIA